MDIKKFAFILSGVVLIAFGIGIFSLRYNDNIGPIGFNGRNFLNVKSNDSNVRIGIDGIDVKDGDDHVQIGWGGIRVKDGDEEVQVGWDGVKVNDGKGNRFDLFDISSWFGIGNRNLKTVDIHEQKNVELGQIDIIKVDSSFIDIKMTSEDRDDIYINYHGRIRSNVIPTLEVEEKDHILNIELNNSRNNYTVVQSDVVLEILLPTGFNGDIEAESSSGDITIMNIVGGNLDIDASSGDIHLDNLKGEEMDIDTSSGKIYLKDITGTYFYINASSGEISLNTLNGNKMVVETSSGDISTSDSVVKGVELTASSGYIKVDNLNSNKTFIKTNSGNITTKESTGDFDLSTSSGNIVLDNKNNYDDYKISTTSGDVELKLPHDSNYTIEGSSSSGRYTPTTDMDVIKNDRGNFKAILGAGDQSIHIDTSSGDVLFR